MERCRCQRLPTQWLNNRRQYFISCKTVWLTDSKHGQLREAKTSGHYIQRDQPELVTQSIRDVIGESAALDTAKFRRGQVSFWRVVGKLSLSSVQKSCPSSEHHLMGASLAGAPAVSKFGGIVLSQ